MWKDAKKELQGLNMASGWRPVEKKMQGIGGGESPVWWLVLLGAPGRRVPPVAPETL